MKTGIAGQILILVEQVRSRLWRAAALDLVRRGLYGAAVLGALSSTLLLWFGESMVGNWLGQGHWRTWLPLLPGALVLMACTALAVGRRPDGPKAARVADHEAGAGELLITAWEIAVRGGDPGNAERIVLHRATRDLPVWQTRLGRVGPRPGSWLIPALLLAATLPVIMLSGANGQEAAPRGAATPPETTAPATRLAAAIADLELGVKPVTLSTRATTTVVDRSEPHANGAARAVDAPGSERAASPPGDGDEGSPPGPSASPGSDTPVSGSTPSAGIMADQDQQGRTSVGAEGAGTQAAPRVPPDRGDERPALAVAPPGPFDTQPVPRNGPASTDPSGPGTALDAGASAAVPASVEAPIAPATAPMPRPAPGLGAGQRALLARYWGQLHSASEP
jgi:hypothetical protein